MRICVVEESSEDLLDEFYGDFVPLVGDRLTLTDDTERVEVVVRERCFLGLTDGSLAAELRVYIVSRKPRPTR